MKKPKKSVVTKVVTRKAEPVRSTSKLSQLEKMLRRPEGATISQLSKALGWQSHSVRGAMSGYLKKKQSLAVTASKADGHDRVYRIEG